MQPINNQSGFTIVEILTTLVVASIIVSLAGPAFIDMIARNRLTTTTNNLIASISYARSEAVRQAQTVNINPTGGDWTQGWTISDQVGTPIRTFAAAPGNVVLDSGGVPSLQFDGRGLLTNVANNIVFSICDDSVDVPGRQITISPTGRPQLEREYGGC